MLLRLLALGMSLAEARSLSYEEMLCLMFHAELTAVQGWIEGEGARIASLSFADPEQQRRALTALAHRGEAELDRFYRRYP